MGDVGSSFSVCPAPAAMADGLDKPRAQDGAADMGIGPQARQQFYSSCYNTG